MKTYSRSLLTSDGKIVGAVDKRRKEVSNG